MHYCTTAQKRECGARVHGNTAKARIDYGIGRSKIAFVLLQERFDMGVHESVMSQRVAMKVRSMCEVVGHGPIIDRVDMQDGGFAADL